MNEIVLFIFNFFYYKMLGIDLGTTKTAIVILNNEGIVELLSEEHKSSLKSDFTIQDTRIHLDVLFSMIKKLKHENKLLIKSIGFTGQMHGVLFWNSEKDFSNLYTWQNKIATERNLLESIRNINGCEKLCDGFGMTTIIAIKDEIINYKYCGTIQDFVVWVLTGSNATPLIDPTNAASWGLYDIKNKCWDAKALKNAGVPINMLPKIVSSGTIAGNISVKYSHELDIPENVPLVVAIGDNQASVIGTGKDYENEAFLTIGTGAQLSYLTKDTFSADEKLEIRPFPLYDSYLVVNAPLCGGDAWKFLANHIRNMVLQMTNVTLDFNDVYLKMDELGLKCIDSNDLPSFHPHFLGERYDVNLRGSITNINMNNFDIGYLSASLALGIIKNLALNKNIKSLNKSKIIASGNTLRKSKVVLRAVEIIFGMSPTFSSVAEEAACGAALFSRLSIR